jgi:hypothetical protein
MGTLLCVCVCHIWHMDMGMGPSALCALCVCQQTARAKKTQLLLLHTTTAEPMGHRTSAQACYCNDYTLEHPVLSTSMPWTVFRYNSNSVKNPNVPL